MQPVLRAALLLTAVLTPISSGPVQIFQVQNLRCPYRLLPVACCSDGTVPDVNALQEQLKNLSASMRRIETAVAALLNETSHATTPTVEPELTTPAPLPVTTAPRKFDCAGPYIALGCAETTRNQFVTFVPLSSKASVVQLRHLTSGGVNHTVALLEPAAAPFCVFCTLDRSMIVQRRVAPFRLGFNRTWHEYKTGFGNPTGEFWVGLENIHSIVSHPSQYALSLQVRMRSGARHYSEVDNFRILDESQQYKIASVGSYTVKGSRKFVYLGTTFATRDVDQKYHCGARFNGFWHWVWNQYAGTNYQCGYSTPNADPPFWHQVKGEMVLVELKLRLVNG
ncbi:Angiopoietin-1 [Lamellibrachia satsuma]|nr:Angiopoietin-1 [Lamellibrachia satsuma]